MVILKKYYYNKFLSEKYFDKQLLSQHQTSSKLTKITIQCLFFYYLFKKNSLEYLSK
jgi:hypothetical protein